VFGKNEWQWKRGHLAVPEGEILAFETGEGEDRQNELVFHISGQIEKNSETKRRVKRQEKGGKHELSRGGKAD